MRSAGWTRENANGSTGSGRGEHRPNDVQMAEVLGSAELGSSVGENTGGSWCVLGVTHHEPVCSRVAVAGKGPATGEGQAAAGSAGASGATSVGSARSKRVMKFALGMMRRWLRASVARSAPHSLECRRWFGVPW